MSFWPVEATCVAARTACLCAATLTFVGCGGDMRVGKDDAYECVLAGRCMPAQLEPSTEDVGTPARASAALEPLWTLSVPGSSIVRSASDGAWLASIREGELVLSHVSPEGEAGPETVVQGPRLPNDDLRLVGDVLGVHAYARGPAVNVRWRFFTSPDGGQCPNGSRCESECECGFRVSEIVMFDAEKLATPTRVELCDSNESCRLGAVFPSGDGRTLLISDSEGLREQARSGEVLARWKLPYDLYAGQGVAVGEEAWLLFGGPSWLDQVGQHALISYARGDAPAFTLLWNIEASGPPQGRGIVLPSADPQRNVLVVERSWIEVGTATGDNTDPRRTPGDISVLRLDGQTLASQQNLLRLEYSSLALGAAGSDDEGNVYIATETGDRTATLTGTLTSLLCRFPATGDGACAELPARAEQLAVTRGGVVLVRSGDVVSRFELPM